MATHGKINYVEFPAKDLAATRAFFEAALGWSFTDYGPDYMAFSAAEAGLDGGFFRSGLASSTERGGALVVLYAERLEEIQGRIEAAGGSIVRPVFAFPGGRRFHFAEPSGNELAVWSDRGP